MEERQRRAGKQEGGCARRKVSKVREMGETKREREKLRKRARSKIEESAATLAKRRAPLSRKHSRYLSNRSLMKPVRGDPQRN